MSEEESTSTRRHAKAGELRIRQGGGRITAAGITADVFFRAAEGAINDQIDAAYRRKYGKSPYLAPMISERARAATVTITPKG
jgi:hypothetical protein